MTLLNVVSKLRRGLIFVVKQNELPVRVRKNESLESNLSIILTRSKDREYLMDTNKQAAAAKFTSYQILAIVLLALTQFTVVLDFMRSEERRVGKECW